VGRIASAPTVNHYFLYGKNHAKAMAVLGQSLQVRE
jgi:hypothetical protein